MKQVDEEAIARVSDIAKRYAIFYQKNAGKDVVECSRYQGALYSLCTVLEALGIVDDGSKVYDKAMDEACRELYEKKKH